MAWSVGIKGEVFVDGDEGTIYLPEEVYQYMKSHKFSIICVKHTPKTTKSISVSAEHYQEHITRHK